MQVTWWDKLCAWSYALYLVFRYGIDLAEKIVDDEYKKAFGEAKE